VHASGRRALAATWILPVEGLPVRDGAVVVADGRIEWVGPRAEAPPAPLEDLGAGVLMPGLVNAHCHLELSHLQGLRADRPGFVPWVDAVVRARLSGPPERARECAAAAVRWLETETATVAVGDVSNTLDAVSALEASTLHAVVFHELLAWDPARADEVLSAAEARRAAVADTDRVRVRLAAHAPHSVSPVLFARLAERGGPAAVHLAESPAEHAFFRDGSGDWPAFLEERGLAGVAWAAPGISPVQYLDRLGVLHPGLLAAHAVQTDDADAATLARRGVAVVVCPSSNRNLDVGTAPVERLLAAGVRVCVGTDSAASGDDLDVAREMRELRREHPTVPAHAIVRMATAAGAEALGFSELGAIVPGRAACFAFAAASRVPADPEAFVVSDEAVLRRVA
jgi:cytosine/adenosine deaminase-related metal-dependent hydrolase